MQAETPTVRLQRFEDVLDGFHRLRASSADSRLSRMVTVVTKFGELVASRPPSFNALSVLRVGPNEVVHSGVLAWLLDGSAGHGQGALFMNVLAGALDLKMSIGPQDHYFVRREFSGWESIIDICVCRPHSFIVFIENKIWAAEGPGQADREWRDLQRTGEANGVPPHERHAVLLTPNGQPPISGDPAKWLPLSYSKLTASLRSVLTKIADPKVAAFVSDWLGTISQWGERP